MAKQNDSYLAKVRERIKSTLLVDALTDHVLNGTEMKNSQVVAAVALLRKVIPDMAQVEHSGEVTQHYVAELPNQAASTDEWSKQQTVQ